MSEIKDGLVLMYVKDGVMYPVALSKEQDEAFEILQQALPGPIKVVVDLPIGKVYGLVKGGVGGE